MRQESLTRFSPSSYLDGDGQACGGGRPDVEQGPGGWTAPRSIPARTVGGSRGVAGAARARARMELATDRRTARCLQAGGAPAVRQGRAATQAETAMRMPTRGARPRAKTISPAEAYLSAGAEEARR